MKKIIAVALILIALLTIASPAFAREAYDPDKPQFIVVAADPETSATYTGVYVMKTVAKLIRQNLLYELYELEADGLIPLDWEISSDGTITLTNTITGETAYTI